MNSMSRTGDKTRSHNYKDCLYDMKLAAVCLISAVLLSLVSGITCMHPTCSVLHFLELITSVYCCDMQTLLLMNKARPALNSNIYIKCICVYIKFWLKSTIGGKKRRMFGLIVESSRPIINFKHILSIHP